MALFPETDDEWLAETNYCTPDAFAHIFDLPTSPHRDNDSVDTLICPFCVSVIASDDAECPICGFVLVKMCGEPD